MINKLTWQAVGLIAVIGAVVVALARFTGWGSGEILALVGILGGLGGGAAVAGATAAMAGGVSDRVEQLQADTTAQTRTLDHVARKVNGELDDRITAAVTAGSNEVLSVLRAQGVIR